MLSPFYARAIERTARPMWRFSEKVHRLQCDFMRRMIMPALLRREPPAYPEGPVSVVALVSHSSWLMGLWMARSLDHHSGLNWQHVWLDDGTLTEEDVAAASRSLRRLRVVRKKESDALLEPVLASRPFLRKTTLEHPVFRRAFLLPLIEPGDRLICIDTDILFFAPPREILAWAQAPAADTACFMYDPVTYYSPGEEILSAWMGRPIRPHVNGGLILYPRGWLDYDFSENLVREFFDFPSRTWHLEQALVAANLTKIPAQPLSKEHEITFQPARRGFCVCRHYVSDGRTRDFFYTEGIRELSSFLLV